MKPIDFYRITQETLNTFAQERGVKDLNRYFHLTDYLPGSIVVRYKGRSQVFVQMALHAQNATLTSSIVKFDENIDFLDKVLCHFDSEKFLDKYNAKSIKTPSSNEAIVKAIVEDLRYTDEKKVGLKWDASKSKPEHKDAKMRLYAKALLDCAKFICRFHTRKEFLNDLLSHYTNKDCEEIIRYFRKNVKNGFSIALTCDFLKEFDDAFSDLPKPDIHIMDTLCAIRNYKNGFYNTEKKLYQCIKDVQQVTKEINESLDADKQITVYQLDRMIWLICSGNFFLDTSINKNLYLKRIKGNVDK